MYITIESTVAKRLIPSLCDDNRAINTALAHKYGQPLTIHTDRRTRCIPTLENKDPQVN